MTTFTITTPVNIDTLASKTGSDVYNINGGYLTVDQHSRYGVNQNTSAAMGNIAMSASLGGTVEFNSTLVRLIPYNTGTGNVPALNTIVSNASASGKLLGVYSALNVAPTSADDAMPATGFILIRQWNSLPYVVGALTGIGASATGVDRPGWLEIVGVDSLSTTVNRLNLFKVRGDYFDFMGATTSGSRATTYQLPTNGSIVYAPGVEVETGVGTGLYEFYPAAGSRLALDTNIATDYRRGRWCWVTTDGLVRFGNDDTNTTGGYLPPAGLRIRVPNIFFMCCTAASRTDNVLPNATLATRYEFATTGGGVIDIDKASVNWYLNLNQPYSVALSNVFTFSSVILTECASPINWVNVGVGQEAANSQTALVMRLNFAGGTMTNCTWTRALQASNNQVVISITDCAGFTITGERIHSLTKGGTATTGSAAMTRVSSSTWTDSIHGGGRALLTTCTDLTYNNLGYYDHPAITTPSTIGMYAVEMGTGCTRCTIDGVNFGGLTMVQPLNGILNILAAGCTDIKLRNLGTYDAPLDLGGARVDKAAWTRATTTATITKVAHGLKVGDRVYVPVSSVTAAIIVGSKTVTAVPTDDTFNFTCLNAGATSGTISYFPTVCANLIVLASSAAANGVKVQRCYVPHTFTNLFSGDNSSKNIVFENVIGDFLNPFATPMLNLSLKGVSGTPALSAQTACYGTHWLDVFNADVTLNLVNQSWSRTSTTCTVTSVDHKLRTGLLVNINESSDIATIPLGIKTVTVIDSDTFTFTCVNTGATSGTVTYRTVIDKISILMNEATAETASQYTDIVGGAAFTSVGGLYMPTIGDSITFIMPDYLLGHVSFPAQELIMVGGTVANYRTSYAIDTGAGFGAWYNLYYARTGGSGTAGQFTFTVTDATGVDVGDYVWGTGVSGNAMVTDVTGNTVTVDKANTATVSGTIRFNHLRSEPLIPSSGFKMKVRITTVNTNANAISSVSFFTDTDDTSRALQYPLDTVDAVLSLTGLMADSEIRVFTTAGDIPVAGVENSSTEFNYNYKWSGDDLNVYIVVHALGYNPIRFENLTLGSEGLVIPVQQQLDRVYSN